MKIKVIKEHYSSLGDLDLRRYYLQITWDEYPIILEQVHHWKPEFQKEEGEVSSDEMKFHPVSYLYWDYKGRPKMKTFTPQRWYLYHTDEMIPLEGITLTGSYKGYGGKTDWRYLLPKELKELVSEITNRAMEEVEPFEMALLEGDLLEYDFAIWERPYPPMRYSPWRLECLILELDSRAGHNKKPRGFIGLCDSLCVTKLGNRKRWAWQPSEVARPGEVLKLPQYIPTPLVHGSII